MDNNEPTPNPSREGNNTSQENPKSEIRNLKSDSPAPRAPQDLFLAALKGIIDGLLKDSTGEITLSAADIADGLKRLGWDGYKDKWLQGQIGKVINEYKLGVYVGRNNQKRVYKFSKSTVSDTKTDSKSTVSDTKTDSKSTVSDTKTDSKSTVSNTTTDIGFNGGDIKSEEFNLGKSLEQLLEEKRGRVPELIEHATAENYEEAVKAISLIEDKVLRENYLKQLSKQLKLPRKLFKDQVKEYLQENKVPYNQPGMEDGGFVDAYNKRFAVLLGSNAGVLNLKHEDLVVYNVSEFTHLITANETEMVCTERGTMRETTKGSLWLKHARRREYQGIEFKPHGGTEGFYNLWAGFPVKPDAKAGTFHHFRELVNDLICNDVEYDKRFVWNWMASLLQFPEKKQGTAIAIRGPKGCGKTVYGEVLRLLLGRYYILADKEEHVSGRFNAHLARCLLLHCDEAFFAGNQKSAGTIKTIITSHQHTIEYKGREPICLDNYTRILITSEKERICSADEQERRYAVFEISPKRQNDIKFFKCLFGELKAGGIQALMAFLLAYKVEERLAIPQNEALKKQQIQNLDTIQSYLVYLCSNGILPDMEIYFNNKNQAYEERITIKEWTETEGVVIRTDALYLHFVQITPKAQYIPTVVQFFVRLNFILKDNFKKLRPRDRDRRCCYWIPAREYMVCYLSEKFGINVDGDEIKSEIAVNVVPTAK